MTNTAFLILAAVADVERHGYGIIQEVRELSHGSVDLGAGTLYGSLERLSDHGLITATREAVVDGRLRRYYRITEIGRTAVVQQADRQESTASAVRLRLAGSHR